MNKILLLTMWLVASVAQATTYSIGNSLTFDTLRNVPLAGIGRHIDAAKPLNIIWNDPNGWNVVEPDPWPVALLEPWGALTLQPHDNGGSTLGSDVQHVGDFTGYSGISNVYALQTWARVTDFPYADYWLGPVVDDVSTPTTRRREYYEHLIDRTGIWMIPIGEVFYELEQRGVDLAPLYRDGQHLASGLGWDTAAVVFQTVTQPQHPSNFNPLPQLFVDTIWDVVTDRRWNTGYADFNFDGVIDGGDLLVWESSGRGGGDFLAWQRTTGVQPTVLAVPEPDGMMGLLVAYIAVYLLVRDIRAARKG